MEDRAVQVPARVDEEITDWMTKAVAEYVNDDHSRISPACDAAKITNLTIPMPKGSEFIGQQVE